MVKAAGTSITSNHHLTLFLLSNNFLRGSSLTRYLVLEDESGSYTCRARATHGSTIRTCCCGVCRIRIATVRQRAPCQTRGVIRDSVLLEMDLTAGLSLVSAAASSRSLSLAVNYSERGVSLLLWATAFNRLSSLHHDRQKPTW